MEEFARFEQNEIYTKIYKKNGEKKHLKLESE